MCLGLYLPPPPLSLGADPGGCSCAALQGGCGPGCRRGCRCRLQGGLAEGLAHGSLPPPLLGPARWKLASARPPSSTIVVWNFKSESPVICAAYDGRGSRCIPAGEREAGGLPSGREEGSLQGGRRAPFREAGGLPSGRQEGSESFPRLASNTRLRARGAGAWGRL